MGLKNKVLVGGVGLLVASNVATMTAFAKEERTAIDKINLEIEHSINDSDVDVTVSSNGVNYSVDEYYINNEPSEEWASYDTPELIIELSCDDDFYFKKESSGYFDIDLGDDDEEATFVKADRDDDKQWIQLMVLLPPKNGELGNPYNLQWSRYGLASWADGYRATNYDVTLHKNNSKIADVETKKSEYNFADKIIENGTGNYMFKVKAENSKRTGKVVESYEFSVDTEALKLMQAYKVSGTAGPGGPADTTPNPSNDLKPIDPTGTRPSNAQVNNYLTGPGDSGLAKGWIRNGENGLWWYRNDDLSWTKDNWQLINNKWYHFDAYGWMQTGWLQLGNDWYYLNPDGAMATGWVFDNGNWYWMTESGAMATGEVRVNGRKYFLNNDGSRQDMKFGALYMNRQIPDGRWADGSGALDR